MIGGYLLGLFYVQALRGQHALEEQDALEELEDLVLYK